MAASAARSPSAAKGDGDQPIERETGLWAVGQCDGITRGDLARFEHAILPPSAPAADHGIGQAWIDEATREFEAWLVRLADL
jgi:hypothetical protein